MGQRRQKISKMLEQFRPHIQNIESYLEGCLQESLKTQWGEESIYGGVRRLEDSMRYGVLGGGKRFRPLLSVLVAQTLGQPEKRVLPLGAAVEFIHSYSLIHDDLPSMDNDEQRRGRPTNHKIYGETIALLAGDALQPEAFQRIGRAYESQPEIAVELILLLSEAIGVRGMVGGQAIDLEVSEKPPLSSLYALHAMKTGALIRVSVEGAAVVCGASKEVRKNLREFGEKLGLAFQLADDLLDHKPGDPERSGFPYIMGTDGTKSHLDQITRRAIETLDLLGEAAKGLKDLTKWNAGRVERENEASRCASG